MFLFHHKRVGQHEKAYANIEQQVNNLKDNVAASKEATTVSLRVLTGELSQLAKLEASLERLSRQA